jgi:hypothetical protein
MLFLLPLCMKKKQIEIQLICRIYDWHQHLLVALGFYSIYLPIKIVLSCEKPLDEIFEHLTTLREDNADGKYCSSFKSFATPSVFSSHPGHFARLSRIEQTDPKMHDRFT